MLALSLVRVPLVVACSAPLVAQTTERITIPSQGGETDAISLYTTMSRDARYVSWQSAATNLVANDTNGAPDVFVRDRVLGVTLRASVATGGGEGDGNSHDPILSADGRYVAFFSYATNLAPNDSNGAPDSFVHEIGTGITTCISVDPLGNPGNGGSRYPSFSGNTRYVAFHSAASNLVAGDSNGVRDIFVRDLETGVTTLESLDSLGNQANGDSSNAVLSHDGRFVAFESFATNLVPSDTNGAMDVFVRDRLTGATERVSVSTGGTQGNEQSQLPSFSADGRFVAFNSQADDLVAGDVNVFSDVFVRDRLLGTTELVSKSSAGAQGNGYSYDASISPDGRWVAFPSRAINLVPGDTTGVYDIFVHDRLTGTTERVTLADDGTPADGQSLYPSITPDGRYVAFDSAATNLVAGDTNGERDIYLRDRGPLASYVHAFCFGDGVIGATACPCGNSGASERGCANSVNANGARIAASGFASVANDTLVLAGDGMPNSSALYFQGTTRQAGGLGSAFGDGLRCAGGAIVRLATKTNGLGESHFPSGGDPSVSVRGGVASGDVRTYQASYRNADATYCTTSTFNLTNGVQIVWGI